MSKDKIEADIDQIIKDKKLTVEEQIAALETMYEEVRAEQRAATESAMVDDQDVGAELRLVELALESLHAEPEAPENKGPATL